MPITPYIPPATLTALPTGVWSGVGGLPVLPYLPGQTPLVTKAPKWSTQVIRTASGRERRTAWWPYPLWQFTLSYEVIRRRPPNDELSVLWEFFNALQGQFAPFLFVDPTDCEIPAVAPQTFATGDGVTTVFQLARSINSVIEPVYAAYAPTLHDNGGPAGSYALTPNGVVTFAAPPAAGHALSWSGHFYFGCRFLQDDLSAEQIVAGLWSGKALKFTSLRA